MVKTERAFQIGELAKQTGTSIRMIRYFDKHGLISSPGRKPRGYRLFTQIHVAEIRWVKKMRELGFSLAEIKRLRDIATSDLPEQEKAKALETMFESKRSQVESQIARLEAIREELKQWDLLSMPIPY